MPPIGVLTHNPGLCPDWESNRPPFSWQASTQPAEPHQPGQIYFIYLFLERGQGKEKERKRNINVWLPLACSLLRTWPATQACALTGNPSGDPLVRRVALNPQSHTSQGTFIFRMFYILGLFLSLWCHFTCFSIPYISYILEVRIKGLI